MYIPVIVAVLHGCLLIFKTIIPLAIVGYSLGRLCALVIYQHSYTVHTCGIYSCCTKLYYGNFVPQGDGTGVASIYGDVAFADESFKLKHNVAGLLSMVRVHMYMYMITQTFINVTVQYMGMQLWCAIRQEMLFHRTFVHYVNTKMMYSVIVLTDVEKITGD